MDGLSVDDDFSMMMVMLVMFINNFIYLTLAYYFESVRPGDHGLAKPWHFPVTNLIKFICHPRGSNVEHELRVNEPINGLANQAEVFVNTLYDNHLAVHIEDENNYAEKTIGIKITNLSKSFTQFGKEKKAVKDLSLNIYEGQITVLLGRLFWLI